ncbi:amidohydrolase family protein [Nonomuraea gerenzanensis]|uniref:Possible chlorohydrolase-like protein n=1 Tax=Nonomuraea gerenzanensis TaxID=93944 RepID=A0A1M4EK64_9ACTN|nr:amidohydrolase family protein [Nonomuraea gerenzanensis]UBU10843.1 amidohydrolase family protein [Nonomuraea gerenzanensis]SBO99277.1 possible chlorohydrolase-like protein [Nonomuraea gerenzanensis]
MPSAKRARQPLGRRAPAPVVIHSAPLVLPMSAEPVRGGAVATRGGRVLAVGPRVELRTSYPAAEEVRWRGMIVAGLVDACSPVPCTAPGVTARARVVSDLADPGGFPGISYVRVTSRSEEEWEGSERDAVITAIREIDRPCAVGIAVHTRDFQVLEDVAVLARTFGLRLLVDLARHSPATLDEAGVLGPLCHVVCARPLDPGERKLLRLRRTVVALCPAAEDALALLEEGNVVAFCDTGDVGPLGSAAAVRRRVRALGLRPRGLDRRLVEAATLGGARALGMDRGKDRIGALAPGARADFAVYDARGRYPYSALLAEPPCLGTVVGGTLARTA